MSGKIRDGIHMHRLTEVTNQSKEIYIEYTISVQEKVVGTVDSKIVQTYYIKLFIDVKSIKKYMSDLLDLKYDIVVGDIVLQIQSLNYQTYKNSNKKTIGFTVDVKDKNVNNPYLAFVKLSDISEDIYLIKS